MISPSDDEADKINFQMLCNERVADLFISDQQPIELLFFRRMFTRLRKQSEAIGQMPVHQEGEEVDEDSEDGIPIQAFQRALGRLFYVLRDTEGFDARTYDQNGNGIVGWSEFVYAWKERKVTVRYSLPERIFLVMDDPQCCIFAKIVSVSVLATISVSSMCFILSTVPDPVFQDDFQNGEAPKPRAWFAEVEFICLIIFLLEYILRLSCCWAVRQEVYDKDNLMELACGYEKIFLSEPVRVTLKFIFSPSNLIDLAAILPGVISWIVDMTSSSNEDQGNGLVVLRLFRLTRIARAVRLGKYVEPVVVIGRTVKQSTKALYVLAFNLLIGIVIFGSLMYLCEQGTWNPTLRLYERTIDIVYDPILNSTVEVLDGDTGGTPFRSIPHAFWWALVTSTTVGYGDNYPTTSAGKTVAMVCMVWSLVILALPVGVIGGTFTQVWDEFAKQKVRDAENLRREMFYVANAMQKIEPSRVSKSMLLQVWNDDGSSKSECDAVMPASPEDFMGEVKLDLTLPMDRSVIKTQKLWLQPNLQRAKRKVHGSVTIQYEWTPHSTDQAASSARSNGSHQLPHQVNEAGDAKTQVLALRSSSASEADKVQLKGTLRFAIVSASNLVNTDWSRKGGASSPYALVICYPNSPAHDEMLRPVVWRAETAACTLHPKWNVSHTFDFLWLASKNAAAATLDAYESAPETPEVDTSARHFVMGAKVLQVKDPAQKEKEAEIEEQQREERAQEQRELSKKLAHTHPAAANASQKSSTSSPCPGNPRQQEEMLHLLRQLSTTVPQLASDLKQVKEEVKRLGKLQQLAMSSTDLDGSANFLSDDSSDPLAQATAIVCGDSRQSRGSQNVQLPGSVL